MYLTKDAQDQMTREDLYVVAQTMQVSNSIKLFILIAEDIQKREPDDVVNQKKFIELLMYQAANLHEVLVVLKEDLYPRYAKVIKDKEILNELDIWIERIRQKEESVKVLEAILNKHAFHVPSDPFFIWNYLTDDKAKEDKLIGVGETIQDSGWFFTWDLDILLAYLMDHILHQPIGTVEAYLKVKHIIADTSKELFILFKKVTWALIKNKIYMKGDKDESRRMYENGNGT